METLTVLEYVVFSKVRAKQQRSWTEAQFFPVFFFIIFLLVKTSSSTFTQYPGLPLPSLEEVFPNSISAAEFLPVDFWLLELFSVIYRCGRRLHRHRAGAEAPLLSLQTYWESGEVVAALRNMTNPFRDVKPLLILPSKAYASSWILFEGLTLQVSAVG